MDVLVTREPGGTPLGNAIRSIVLDPAAAVDPIAEMLLMNASRAQLVTDVIGPALKAGQTVLCDRFFDATLAYQGYGRGLDLTMLLEVVFVATRHIAPDITFLIDIPVALSHERVVARGATDRLEREDAEFHERVRAGYLQLAARFPRMHVLDGTLPPDEVTAAAKSILDAHRATVLHP